MKSKTLKHLKEVFHVNKKLVISVAVAACGLVALQGYISVSQLECLGVAESKETTIAFETGVVVKRIFVLPGQKVTKGQPLLEVEPAELNIRMLEVRTELEALESELKFRNSLMDSFSSKKKAKKQAKKLKGELAPEVAKEEDTSPIAQQVAGYRRQLDELKRLQGQSVRFAEEDGTVATVTYGVNEQVPPFQPIITISSSVPNLVYGFIHEDRLSDFKVGDRIAVETMSQPKRGTQGKVVSLGSRITLFPERLQTAFGTLYWGRELIVALPANNQFFMGEKVRLHSRSIASFTDLSSTAFADTVNGSAPFRERVPLEGGGLVYSQADGQLLIVADDNGPNKSPFWIMSTQDNSVLENLKIESPEKIEDLESLSFSNGYYYAMSSLAREETKGKGKGLGEILAKRTRMIRFQIVNGVAIVDRVVEVRNSLLAALQQSSFLQAVSSKLDEKLEIEAMTIDGSDAYIALKEPQLSDGSTFIIQVKNIVNQLEASDVSQLDISVHSLVWLKDPACKDASRITDLVKTSTGLMITGNCSKKEAISQVWWLPNGAPSQQVQMMVSISNARLEGIAVGSQPGEYFLSSDNGKDFGSDFFKIQVNETQQ